MANDKSNEDAREEASALFGTLNFSVMDEAYVSLHLVFEGLQSVGFTEKQALWIVAAIVGGSCNLSDNPDGT